MLTTVVVVKFNSDIVRFDRICFSNVAFSEYRTSIVWTNFHISKPNVSVIGAYTASHPLGTGCFRIRRPRPHLYCVISHDLKVVMVTLQGEKETK